MEVWALEAYGSAFTLQELLTIKSDDVLGRSKMYESIIKNRADPPPTIPESFNVLLKELEALSLDVSLLQEQKTEKEVKEKVARSATPTPTPPQTEQGGKTRERESKLKKKK